MVRRHHPRGRAVRHGARRHRHERVDLDRRSRPQHDGFGDAGRHHVLHADHGVGDAAGREAGRPLGQAPRIRDRLDRLRDRFADHRSRTEHRGAVPGLVRDRRPGRRARDPSDRRPGGGQLPGSRPDHRICDRRRGLGRRRSGRPADRRFRHHLLQLALRVRRRGRDHGCRGPVRARHPGPGRSPSGTNRYLERAALGRRSHLRRLRNAAEQDLGLDHPARVSRDQRQAHPATRNLAQRLADPRWAGCCSGHSSRASDGWSRPGGRRSYTSVFSRSGSCAAG